MGDHFARDVSDLYLCKCEPKWYKLWGLRNRRNIAQRKLNNSDGFVSREVRHGKKGSFYTVAVKEAAETDGEEYLFENLMIETGAHNSWLQQ